MKPANFNPLLDGSVVVRALICTAGFGGFAAWAGLAPLDEGITAGGAVMVEEHRQQVQHLEGGIVAEVAVAEGDKVKRGQTLLVLNKASPGAQRDQLQGQIGSLEASLARLTALRDGAAGIDFAGLEKLGLAAEAEADIRSKQAGLFQQARNAHQADVAMLDARRDAALSTAAARKTQVEAARRGLDATRRQLDGARQQLEKRMVRLDQVETLERSQAELEAEIARLSSEQLEAEASAKDFAAQIERAKIEFQQTVAEELVEVNTELASKREAFGAAEDVLARTVITAPADGEVLNLTANTVGGVVRGGETILEVVPESAAMVAAVRVRPVDRASVRIGQKVRTQLVAYKAWQVPRLEGEIVGVSADLKVDQATGAPYYEARISIPGAEAAKLGSATSAPGMPVQVFIYSGARRTLFQQLGEPILDSWFRGMHQS